MDDAGTSSRWRRVRARLASVRARTTMVAVLVVGSALAVGGFELVHLLSDVLVGNVTNQVRSSVSALAVKVQAGDFSGGLTPPPGNSFAQIVDFRGMVVASSADIAGNGPLGPFRSSSGNVVVSEVRVLPSNDDGPFVLGYRSVTTPAGPVIIYVASSLSTVGESVHAVTTTLFEGLPLLVVMVGILSWVLAGRALRPVEVIRRSVAETSGGDLSFRVPEPVVEDEVGLLARTMNSMLERLQGEADRRRRMVSDASHELRSPIASMQTNLEVAQAHPGGTDWPGLVDILIPECQRMARTIDDLLTLAKADEGTLVSARRAVDLDEIVMAEGRRLRMAGRVAVDLKGVSGARVIGDLDQLSGMVRNLVDNAQRHAASRVVLELNRSDRDVALVVADDGAGIPLSERQRVFERFHRLDEARSRDAGGSGLGLAIVREIAEAHGGSVDVTDSEVGARLEVRLPAQLD
ncbi:MAG: sensor histidine kinase [Acidimicrobiales bacterium]